MPTRRNSDLAKQLWAVGDPVRLRILHLLPQRRGLRARQQRLGAGAAPRPVAADGLAPPARAAPGGAGLLPQNVPRCLLLDGCGRRGGAAGGAGRSAGGNDGGYWQSARRGPGRGRRRAAHQRLRLGRGRWFGRGYGFGGRGGLGRRLASSLALHLLFHLYLHFHFPFYSARGLFRRDWVAVFRLPAVRAIAQECKEVPDAAERIKRPQRRGGDVVNLSAHHLKRRNARPPIVLAALEAEALGKFRTCGPTPSGSASRGSSRISFARRARPATPRRTPRGRPGAGKRR